MLLTGVSYFGIKAGAMLQNALTMLKLLAVVALVVTGVFIAAPHAPAPRRRRRDQSIGTSARS